MSEYEVGFGKPPHTNQFKPGKSGNPKGRPRGHKNLATLLDDICNETMVVMENGKKRRLTKKEIAMRQLVTKAMKGDMRALEKLIAEITVTETSAYERQTRSALSLTPEMQDTLRERLLVQQVTLLPAVAHSEASSNISPASAVVMSTSDAVDASADVPMEASDA